MTIIYGRKGKGKKSLYKVSTAGPLSARSKKKNATMGVGR